MGFFRIDEIDSFRLHDIIVNTDHMAIYVAKRKNDQYREGYTSYLTRFGKSTCPVTITEKILKVLPQSSKSFLLVRRIVKSKAREYFHVSKGVSVSTLRGNSRSLLSPPLMTYPSMVCTV